MRKHEIGPKALSRVVGALYLLMILLGMFAENLVGGRLIVAHDAAATAANILAHREFFQLGFAAYLLESVCYIGMTIGFYELLKSVNRTASLLAASLGLVGCVVKTVSRLFFLMPLFVLDGAPFWSGLTTAQVQGVALLLLKINAQGAAVAMVFFGFYSLVKGYLIVRSTFLPRVLGWIGMAAGTAWLTFLYSPLAYRLLPYTMMLGLIGSATQIFWLLVFGVDQSDGRSSPRTTDSRAVSDLLQ